MLRTQNDDDSMSSGRSSNRKRHCNESLSSPSPEAVKKEESENPENSEQTDTVTNKKPR